MIIPPDHRPEPHEIATAQTLAALGHAVVFLVPNRAHGHKNPDVLIDGLTWELKSPTGAGRHTIAHQLSRAGLQSPRLVLDTRRTVLEDEAIAAEIGWRLARSRRLDRVMLVTKDIRLVELSKP